MIPYLAVQHNGNWVVTIRLIKQVIDDSSSIERIRVAVGLISSLPVKEVRIKLGRGDLLRDLGQVSVDPARKETVRPKGAH